MADSVDRVFVHALNTVKKLPRSGTARPPLEDRLKLYGLYKQSMEGDVSSVMPRPLGISEDSVAEQNKWQGFLEFTKWLVQDRGKEAAMHRYATSTPDSKELVAELEFVWDQIKSNVPSSSSSSPHELQTQTKNDLSRHASNIPDDESSIDGEAYQTMDEFDEHGLPKMLVLNASAMNENDDEVNAAEDEEEAPFSTRPRPRSQRIQSLNRQDSAMASSDGGRRSTTNTNSPAHNRKPSKAPSSNEPLWRRRVEQALTKMTAEVAALREQLEIRRYAAAAARTRLAVVQRWMTTAAWYALKHLFIDAALILLVLAWMKRKGDKRAELVIKLMSGFLSEKLFWWRRKGKKQYGRPGGVVAAGTKALAASSEIVAFT